MKLRHIVAGLVSVALVAFVVSDALGQDERRRGERDGRGGPGGGFQHGRPPGGGSSGRPGHGGRGGGDAKLGLLGMEAVRAELQISPDQEAALAKIAEQNRPQRPDVDFRKMSEEERRELFERMRKEHIRRSAKMKERLEEVLRPGQIERLEQISLQLRGVEALGDDHVAGKLDITEDQKRMLEKVREDLQQKMREQMREIFASGDRENMREAFGKIREEMQAAILSILSSEQRQKFDTMKGESFEMPEGMDRGGPGGGRGGFGGRDGRGRPGGGGERRRRPPADQ